jgi:uncharacterized protein (TIGR03437 family)
MYAFKFQAGNSSSGIFTLNGSGTITVGLTTTLINLSGFTGPAAIANAASGTLQLTSGSVTPFGSATVKFSGMNAGGAVGPVQSALTFAFNSTDSFIASIVSSTGSIFEGPENLSCSITGGTGKFNGATGSLAAAITETQTGNSYTLTGSGTITVPAPEAAMVTSVTTAFGGPTISQNTYIVITGTNLVPANTPAAGAIWSSAPSFANGQMPTQLGPISVTVNNKPAFVYFYCSAATDPACPQDQLNILTPLDNTVGPVLVTVTNGAVSSPPFTASLQNFSPSFLLFNAAGNIVATHPDGSLLGPAGLYPASTPAKSGETIVLYAVGFGLPITALVNGSAAQSGPLPALPVCQVGGAAATLKFAGLITPGLYQLNLVVPASAPNGNKLVSCSYVGFTTPPGNLIAVQN